VQVQFPRLKIKLHCKNDYILFYMLCASVVNFLTIYKIVVIKIIYRENGLYYKRLKSLVQNNGILLFSSHAPLNPSDLGFSVFDIDALWLPFPFPALRPACRFSFQSSIDCRSIDAVATSLLPRNALRFKKYLFLCVHCNLEVFHYLRMQN
jgi:hypothetical protein